MRRNLYWLSDEQWRQIEPHLSQDVRGKARVDEAQAAPERFAEMSDFSLALRAPSIHGTLLRSLRCNI
jgi:hypothetical protein